MGKCCNSAVHLAAAGAAAAQAAREADLTSRLAELKGR
jgi:hypothetical protein